MTRHAYTVSKITEDYVYIINPYNTSETIKVAINDFWQFFDTGCTLDTNKL